MNNREGIQQGEWPVEKVVKINRVAKVVKGGRRFSFSAVAVVGNGNGRVGWGLGKANEVAESIRKAIAAARKNCIDVPMRGTTIKHQIVGHYGAAKVLLKPASDGTGIITGGPVRALCEAAGIKNILSKSLKSNNAMNVLRAAVDGFKKMKKDAVESSDAATPAEDGAAQAPDEAGTEVENESGESEKS